MSTSSKAVRVEEVTATLMDCPVCHGKIEGTITVAVHLGGITLTGVQDDVDSVVGAEVNATTQLRALRVRHDCEARVTRAEGAPTDQRLLAPVTRDEPQA